MRSRMEPEQRDQHDEAWGLSFGAPDRVRIAPKPIDSPSDGLPRGLAESDPRLMEEHPMSEAMAGALDAFLREA